VKVGIIGAGIIGLTLGWRLAQQGVEVHIFDKAQAGKGASWAAGGMLGACSEIEPGQESGFELGRRSQELWGPLIDELSQASGLDLGYRTEGTLLVAKGESELEQLHQRYKFQKRLGADVEWLSPEALRTLEPSLSDDIEAAILCAQDFQLDPRQVLNALKIAFTAAGGSLHEEAAVTEILIEGKTARALITKGETTPFDKIILAAGWEAGNLLRPHGFDLPLSAVKGQMAAIEFATPGVGPRHVVRGPSTYVIPRSVGSTESRIVIGATSAPGVSDCEVDTEGTKALIESAIDLVPSFKTYAYDQGWAGVRPATPDGLPILGEGGLEGLTLAVGHHRNGILWAPATAELLTNFIVTGEAPALLQALGHWRFA
jgi:glycine oxidase